MADVETQNIDTGVKNPDISGAELSALLDEINAVADAPVAEAAPTTPVEPPPVAEAVPAETDSPDARRARIEERALSRIAERERKVAEKERELAARDSAKPTGRTWSKAQIRQNPAEYLKTELGMDPGAVARALMVDALGDKAPDEYRRIAAGLKDGGARDEQVETLNSRLADLEARYETAMSSQRAEQYRREYHGQLNQYVSGDVSKYPHAARVFKEDPSWAMAAAWNIVSADADHKIRSNAPDAAPLAPEEVVAALNAELANMARRIGAPAAPPPERKTLLNPTPVPAPGQGSDVESLSREAMDWLLKQ